MARINQYRATGADCRSQGRFGPAPALNWNALLTNSSAAHSQDMATQNYFSHTSLDGRTMADRISAAGYVWRTIGENIAAGHGSVNAVIDGWMASDGHCANIMNPAFRDVGLACVVATRATYGTYWTMNLGAAR